jgi:hypothetical protein
MKPVIPHFVAGQRQGLNKRDLILPLEAEALDVRAFFNCNLA